MNGGQGDGGDEVLETIRKDHKGARGLGEGVCFNFNGKSGVGGRHNLVYEKRIVAEHEWKWDTRQKALVEITASSGSGLDRVVAGRHGWIWVIWSLTMKLPVHWM